MGLDNRAADRQAHTQPVRLGRIEGIEDMVEALRVQPRTRILHRDYDALCPIGAGSNQQLAWTLVSSTHRFDGVYHQIENYLLQLDSIRKNEGYIIRELNL